MYEKCIYLLLIFSNSKKYNTRIFDNKLNIIKEKIKLFFLIKN